MYYVPDGTEQCGYYECKECGSRFLDLKIAPTLVCPYCGEEADMEIGPDEEMPKVVESAKLIQMVRGVEEVEKMDKLLLNIEDDTFKHNDICKALSGCGIKDVEWSNNLADGWKQIKNSIDSNNPYDLIITDMYYPDEPGGREEQSGDVLIDRVIKNKITIPVILCSSVNLKYPEIYGCVYYSRERNWEADMQTLVNSLVAG